MTLNDIKAPEPLKEKTICLMNKELNHKRSKKPFKVAIIAACIPVLVTLTAFTYNLFSGLAGDELSFFTEYKGNGIVAVTVENQSDKELKFTNTIKLKQWSTNQEVLNLEQEMPLIKAGEAEIITIDLSDYDVELLETPLLNTDWYYFVFTNNNFQHGHDWMASVTFAEPIITDPSNAAHDEILPSDKPIEDNTSQSDVNNIKNNYLIQKPLSEFNISCPYNDNMENGQYVHAEVDLKAELGTDIYSISKGKVIEVDYDEETGSYIIIDHGKGLKSKYAHCKEIFKEQGDTIALDDVIASVGKTGKATGAYLAFSVTLNGVPINPELIFE